jgi:type VI protein secretion system component Hcp
MAVKKSSFDVQKSKNVGKRPAKFTVPKGEKVTSMKHVDASSPILFNHCPPTKP